MAGHIMEGVREQRAILEAELATTFKACPWCPTIYLLLGSTSRKVPRPPKTAPQAGDQVFKHISLRGTSQMQTVTSSQEKKIMGWGDSLVGKCLLHIHEDLSLHPQSACKDRQCSGSLQSLFAYSETKDRDRKSPGSLRTS